MAGAAHALEELCRGRKRRLREDLERMGRAYARPTPVCECAPGERESGRPGITVILTHTGLRCSDSARFSLRASDAWRSQTSHLHQFCLHTQDDSARLCNGKTAIFDPRLCICRQTSGRLTPCRAARALIGSAPAKARMAITLRSLVASFRGQRKRID